MKRVVILQARTTSTRLPGKVLMDLAGKPMIVQQLERLKRCREIDEIVVATSTNATDDPLIDRADAAGVRWFRGSELDVLDRFRGAAREADADIVIRSTADCPLIEPAVVDRVVLHLAKRQTELDYASNVVMRTYPCGLDIEAMFRDTLERVARLGRSPESREHVTQFILREHPELFLIDSVEDVEDNSDLSWTVDTAEDLDRVRFLYEALDLGRSAAPYAEIVRFARTGGETN